MPWIAQQLGCHRNNVYLIFSRQWIDTGTLMKLSIILQYNFFAELSEWYKDAGFTMELSGTTHTLKK
ncbi:MAG: XRE family transcriptional regulator [Bacteroidales bacterium]|nr:XRE family transcriptional regulator [Bacteroidales bacterium]